MTDTLTQVLADLAAEGDRLEQLVSGLDDDGWRTPTPADGWDVATQVAHLAWTDEVAEAAATDKERWDGYVLEAINDPTGYVDACALEIGRDPALLERWRDARTRLAAALTAYPQGERMPWFGPPMSATSMATARLMETWAHSLDVHEALGVPVEDTDAIRHVAHLGVRTRNYSFANNGLEAPGEEFRLELVAPSGEMWTWGPEDAAQVVTGSAGDFCRLVTQRIHRADTDLVATGADADRWLDVAQCFAGPAGEGRAPR
ncbi:TIGR03084 family metal-binding protein [Nocardioides sp. zg-1228]|uniref:TIGR03084 family metal-binding protein n=1 Tax=Nocardioides sp. zg-1228 TaxID=2763008 RepID=UPI0016428D3F|nr:TIGR03084 family metal-binding protein [Nocardioides sp. zg-1228]MBC2931923.1 TIGR03084 family protein [Nocardioides sp. zg-1228]QSF57483.1 TIGR03084 family protein [Nocardioides sp. zg-1228]